MSAPIYGNGVVAGLGDAGPDQKEMKALEAQETPPNLGQTKQEPPVEERQPWEQPKLEQLHVSLDTAATSGSGNDLAGRTKAV